MNFLKKAWNFNIPKSLFLYSGCTATTHFEKIEKFLRKKRSNGGNISALNYFFGSVVVLWWVAWVRLFNGFGDQLWLKNMIENYEQKLWLILNTIMTDWGVKIMNEFEEKLCWISDTKLWLKLKRIIIPIMIDFQLLLWQILGKITIGSKKNLWPFWRNNFDGFLKPIVIDSQNNCDWKSWAKIVINVSHNYDWFLWQNYD